MKLGAFKVFLLHNDSELFDYREHFSWIFTNISFITVLKHCNIVATPQPIKKLGRQVTHVKTASEMIYYGRDLP